MFSVLNVKNRPPKKNISALITNLFLIILFMMPIMATALYVGSCNFHFLASVLPVCVDNDSKQKSDHRGSWFFIMFYAAVQVMFVTVIMCASFPYVAVGLDAICEGLDMIKDLRSPNNY